MIIQTASIKDFKELYNIGKSTKELRVSATEEFMDIDEFKYSIKSPDSVFLVAKEKNKIIGFIYANANDIEKPFEHKYACIVYIVVIPEFRGKGVAQKLYFECAKRLKKLGITNIYSWASTKGKQGIIKFFKKQKFAKGHEYIWMDKKIS